MRWRRVVLVTLMVLAMPVPCFAWWNPDWGQRREITLMFRAEGGASDAVARAPVPIRLHGGVFDFTQAKPDGSDLRFVADDDKTTLNYHIERFDPATELGFVWVDVPNLAPGAVRKIWLYYGNAAARSSASSAQTYDSEQSLVWHLNEEIGLPKDQTANANQAQSLDTRVVPDGLVGGAFALTSRSQIRTFPSTALAIQPGGAMTWSAWIRPALSAAADGLIYSKLGAGSDSASDRLAVGLRNGTPYVS